MGPRLVGRGKPSHRRPPPPGAATFNGAASCGTRKGPALAHLSEQPVYLQWGRVLWDAERATTRSKGGSSWILQWGRVLWDAERQRNNT